MTAWPRVRFGEFSTPNRRPYTLGPTEDANLVGMRWYGLGPFHRELKPAAKIRKKSHFVIRSGDVIYNKLFAWKGAFGMVPDELGGMFVSDKFPTYELDETVVERRYLAFYFRCPTLWEEAQRLSTGSAAISKLTLNQSKFDQLTIPLPHLSEQRRIVAKVEQLAAMIEEARGLRQTLKERADALFFALLDSIMGEISEDFPRMKLVDVVNGERGISYGIVQTGTQYEGGIPTLRAGDLQQFHVNIERVKQVDPEIEAKHVRTRLEGNEVLLRIRGGLGEVAVCPREMIGGNVSREIAVIPLLEGFDPSYVMFVMAAPSRQEFLRRHLRGTSYVGINLKDVRCLEIAAPPLDEQRRIVGYLEGLKAKVEQLKTLQAQTGTELDALLPSILDKAFKGEL